MYRAWGNTYTVFIFFFTRCTWGLLVCHFLQCWTMLTLLHFCPLHRRWVRGFFQADFEVDQSSHKHFIHPQLLYMDFENFAISPSTVHIRTYGPLIICPARFRSGPFVHKTPSTPNWTDCDSFGGLVVSFSLIMTIDPHENGWQMS